MNEQTLQDQRNIMLVDDEPDTLRVLEKTLTAEGFTITSVNSAATLDAALNLESPHLPDLIILDLGLPDIDGQEIAQRLKANPKTQNIPIVFLTARYSEGEIRNQAHHLDGHVIFAKPYHRDELITAIKDLLNCQQKVLIVDDEEDVLSVLEKGLLAQGFSVDKAHTGIQALDIAKTAHPDLVILDLELPDIYGGDVARRLTQDPITRDIPVMFLSGMFPEEPKDGRTIAGHILFAKPYDLSSLVSSIKKLIHY